MAEPTMSGPSAEERAAQRLERRARYISGGTFGMALGFIDFLEDEQEKSILLLERLADALSERDEARAEAGRLREALSAAGTAAWHHRIKHPPSHARLLSIEADAARLTGVVGPGHGDDPIFQKFYQENYPEDAALEQPHA